MIDDLWNGKSTLKLQEAFEESARLGAEKLARVQAIDQEFDERIRHQREVAAQQVVSLLAVEGLNAQAVHFGSWDCPESPTGRCVYDITKDPMRDECLICEDPSDRG